MSVSAPADSPAHFRPAGRAEFARLLAAGVNPRAAEVLACHTYAAAQKRARADTAAYAAARARRMKRARDARYRQRLRAAS